MNPGTTFAGDLEEFRGYLRLLAGERLGPGLRGTLDPDDLVQQTFLKACQGRDSFRGEGPAQTRAWLRTILANAIVDHLRKSGAATGGDRSLDATVAGSSDPSERPLADPGSTPSHRASRKERDAILASALLRLPEDQRRAVELRHLRGRSLEEVAARMGRSVPAISGLVRRGLLALRADLGILE
jgi:RNA polymerase sigma-70 factor (ECF subfamily)